MELSIKTLSGFDDFIIWGHLRIPDLKLDILFLSEYNYTNLICFRAVEPKAIAMVCGLTA